MALTSNSSLYGSVSQDAINGIIALVQLQRPSLFNYGTQAFADRAQDKKLGRLLCTPIKVDDRVRNAGDPYIRVEAPLPVIGSAVAVGLNWLLQISDVTIDLAPGDALALPPELGELPKQSLAFRAKACFALDCPDRKFVDQVVSTIEQQLEDKRDADDARNADEQKLKVRASRDKGNDEKPLPIRVPELGEKIACACVEVFAVAHCEWGPGGTQIPPEEWFKVRLDGLEIVDIGPEQLESQMECYLSTVLRFSILPALALPISRLVLDLTKEINNWGLPISKRVTLSQSPVPTSVPNNPSIESNEIRVFVDLKVENI